MSRPQYRVQIDNVPNPASETQGEDMGANTFAVERAVLEGPRCYFAFEAENESLDALKSYIRKNAEKKDKGQELIKKVILSEWYKKPNNTGLHGERAWEYENVTLLVSEEDGIISCNVLLTTESNVTKHITEDRKSPLKAKTAFTKNDVEAWYKAQQGLRGSVIY